MTQTEQLAGAVLILAAFITQLSTQDVRSQPVLYLLCNTLGSTILAVDAYLGRDWGFLLLEGSWALVSAVGLGRTLIARTRPAPPGGGPVVATRRQAPRPGGRHRAPTRAQQRRARTATTTVPALPGSRSVPVRLPRKLTSHV